MLIFPKYLKFKYTLNRSGVCYYFSTPQGQRFWSLLFKNVAQATEPLPDI